MRKSSILILFFFLSCIAYGQPINFKLTGRFINNTTSHTLYMFGPGIYDSIKLKPDHSFNYTGKMETPGPVLLKTEHTYAWAIWVTNGNIQTVLEEYTPEGIKPTDMLYIKIDSLKGPDESVAYHNITMALRRISLQYKSHTPEKNDSVMHDFTPIIKEYVQKSPGSWLSPFLVREHGIALADKKALLDIMHDNPNKEELKNLEHEVQRLTLFEKGKKLDDFTQPSITGQPFELYSLKKSFILLKFWSSDCIPCRYEHPDFIKVYSKYQSKGLEIVSISLDNENAGWAQAVKKDGLPWINISDLQGFKGTLAEKYFIDYVPFNILLDNSYAVVATNVSSYDLAKIIESHSSN